MMVSPFLRKNIIIWDAGKGKDVVLNNMRKVIAVIPDQKNWKQEKNYDFFK